MDLESLKLTTDFFLYAGTIPHELVIMTKSCLLLAEIIRVNKSLNTVHYICT